jgi:hypothetical protein
MDITKSDGTLKSIEDIENHPDFLLLSPNVLERWNDLKAAMKANDEAVAELTAARDRERVALKARAAALDALEAGKISEHENIKQHILSERIRERRV